MFIWYILHPFGNVLAKIGFASVINPVFVADRPISDDFELWPDLDPTCDILKFFFNFPKKYSFGAIDCRPVRPATTTRSRIRHGGKICPTPAVGRRRPQRDAG